MLGKEFSIKISVVKEKSIKPYRLAGINLLGTAIPSSVAMFFNEKG